MTRRMIGLSILCAIIVAGVWTMQPGAAQTPAPVPITPAMIQPTGTATSIPVQTAVRNRDEARLASCAAHTLPNFYLHVVLPGDTLRGLLSQIDNATVTQVAAVNCIDDPDDLPVGAVIWLPGSEVDMNTATVFSTGEPLPEIGTVIVNPERVSHIETITLSWRDNGYGGLLIACTLPDSDDDCWGRLLGLYLPNRQVQLSGFQYPGTYRYRMIMFSDGAYSQDVPRDVYFEVTCAYPWIRGVEIERCADAPPDSVTGAYQSFEGGVMLWFSDSHIIYFLQNDTHRVMTFEDTYREGELIETGTPPDGFFAPVRGFSKIWTYLQENGQDVGWALEPEVGAELLRQPAGRVSYTTYIGTPDGVYAVTDIPTLTWAYAHRISD